MSNQFFALLLVLEGFGLCALHILYFVNYRREPTMLISAVVYGLYGIFFFLLGGGVSGQGQAARLIYAIALLLLFSQGSLMIFFLFRAFPEEAKKSE